MASGIYKIVNKVNMKCLIGYSKDLELRRNTHLSELNRRCHRNSYLQRAYNKYGRYNFSFEILQECPIEELCFWEDYWCKVLKTHDREFGYNLQPTKPDSPVIFASKETREKMRVSQKGKKHNYPKGVRKTNPETVRKIANSNRGKKRSLEYRLKYSKKVINTITGEIYGSGHIVAEMLNMKYASLAQMLNHRRKNKTIYEYL